MADHIIAYDLGTGGAKASLYDREGTCRASTFVSYETFYPDSGWHEQRPEDWWNAIVQSTRELLAKKLAAPSDIASFSANRSPSGPTRAPKRRRLPSSKKSILTNGS